MFPDFSGHTALNSACPSLSPLRLVLLGSNLTPSSNEKTAASSEDIFDRYENFFIQEEGRRQFYISRKNWGVLNQLTRAELYRRIARVVHESGISFPHLAIQDNTALQDYLSFKKEVESGEDFLLNQQGTEPRYSIMLGHAFDPCNAIQNPFYDVIIKRTRNMPGWLACEACHYDARIAASCHPFKSPREMWSCSNGVKASKSVVPSELINHLHRIVNAKPLEERDATESDLALAISRSVFTPSQFPCYAVPAIVKFLRQISNTPDRILWKMLDTSSGWDNRKVGAMASESMLSHYVGIDPNQSLIKGQIKACTLFPSKVKVMHICKGAEDVKSDDFGSYREMLFDILLTSPPFFIKESYSADNSQSDKRYIKQELSTEENVKNWLEHFLFPMLKKAWKRIRPGGYAVINMDDYREMAKGKRIVHNITDPMNTFLGKELGGKYLGCMGLALNPIAAHGWAVPCDPIFIWQKPKN